MDKCAYENQMTIFKEWEKKETVRIKGTVQKREGFNADGIVNPDVWFQLPQDKRILFVLKETNDSTHQSWPLTEKLHEKELCNATIWRRTAEWAKGILSCGDEKNTDAYEWLTGDKAKEYVQKIAVLNLKKTPGGNSAVPEEIEAYAREDIDLIEQEIGIIDPAIIVFGGTFEIFRNAYTKVTLEKGEHWPYYCYKTIANKERLLIDYWHPAGRYPAVMTYYGIVGICQAALKEKSIDDTVPVMHRHI